MNRSKMKNTAQTKTQSNIRKGLTAAAVGAGTLAGGR